MKKLFLTLGGFFIVLLVLGFFFKNQIGKNNSIYTGSKNLTAIVTVAGNPIRVEIVKSASDKSKGLSNQKYLGEDFGMLFDLQGDDLTHVFWMKDMLIPIDIIWIKDNKVIQIDGDLKAPEPNTPDSDLEKFTPSQDVDFVLEVNAGYVTKKGIRVGDEFEILPN